MLIDPLRPGSSVQSVDAFQALSPLFLPMHAFPKYLLLGSLLGLLALADEPAPVRPWETSELNVETGMLWGIGTGTPLAYRLTPTQLSWRSKKLLGHVFEDGSRLVVRHRLTLIGTWVQHGPETRY